MTTAMKAQGNTQFVTGVISKVGGRAANEDSCGFAEVGDTACWVVADGLGGHVGGKAASEIAVEAALASFRAKPELSQAALKNHLEAAQQEILRWQREDPTLSGMSTTVVVLISDVHSALWAHVGDSRFYCLEAGRIVLHTKDHSVLQALVDAGELSDEQIRYHKDRNRILRSLGNEDADFSPNFVSEQRSLYRGTAFLLCTDGFWEHVFETEMEADFAKAVSPDDWLARMEARLLERAPEDHDNYTAMAACFTLPTAPLPPQRPSLPQPSERFISKRLRSAALIIGILLVALAGGGIASRTSPTVLRQVDRVRSWLSFNNAKEETKSDNQPEKKGQANEKPNLNKTGDKPAVKEGSK